MQRTIESSTKSQVNSNEEPSKQFQGTNMMEDADRFAKIGLYCFLGVIICFAGTVLYLGPKYVMTYILRSIPNNPSWEWYLPWAIITMVSIVCLLPIWPPMCMASGLMFGFWNGWAVNIIAIFGAAVISFLLGRAFLKEPISNALRDEGNPQIRRLLRVLEDSDEALKFQILFRFLFIPMFVRNYGPSVLNIPIYVLALGSIPHTIWISFLFSSLGCAFKGVAEIVKQDKELSFSSMHWQQFTVFFVSFLVALVLSYYAYTKYSERVAEEAEEGTDEFLLKDRPTRYGQDRIGGAA
eukprot:TRINITY_DN47858_c0_g1_i1.p1 TRINITY_DN47858_c0_g1~~TRINITY_DN47858_c0_g1_i1.p1  ORF type:complete len:296 (+),score=30.87 TRINITY_DN47858_c0_g1_i1:171-1058(+)